MTTEYINVDSISIKLLLSLHDMYEISHTFTVVLLKQFVIRFIKTLGEWEYYWFRIKPSNIQPKNGFSFWVPDKKIF
jgi:hypothetical protein